MADRVVVGKANDGTSDVYGLWVSKPGVSVITAGVLAGTNDLLFDSRNPYGQVLSATTVTLSSGVNNIGFTAVNGKKSLVLWWYTSSTKLSSADPLIMGEIEVTQSVTGTTGTLTFDNSTGSAVEIGYIISDMEAS